MHQFFITGNNTQQSLFNHNTSLNQTSNPDTAKAEACDNCGSKQQKIGAGKAPGQGSLLCGNGHFQRWLSASEVKAIAFQMNQQGGQW